MIRSIDQAAAYYQSHAWIHDFRLMWVGSTSTYDEDEFQKQIHHSSSHTKHQRVLSKAPVFAVRSLQSPLLPKRDRLSLKFDIDSKNGS